MPDESFVVTQGPLMLRVSREDGAHVVCLYGELDMSTADVLERELQRLEASDGTRIVVDLSGLAFMDSSGLRALLAAHARARTDGDRLSLLRGRPEVQRIFEITATDSILPFDD